MDYGKDVIALLSKQLIRWATVMTVYIVQEINHVTLKWQWQY